MADSDITNLPELILPAVGDNLVIDDISDGVSTRTKRITATNFFNNFLGVIGITLLKANNISSVSGGAVTLADNLVVSKPATNTTISLVGNANGTFYNLATNIGGDLVIDAIHNLSAKPLRITSLAPTGSLVISNSGKLNIPFGIETNSIEANSDAVLNIINSYSGQSIGLSTQGGYIDLDGFRVRKGHINIDNSKLESLLLAGTLGNLVGEILALPYELNVSIPVSGQIRFPGVGAASITLWSVSYYTVLNINTVEFGVSQTTVAGNGSISDIIISKPQVLSTDTRTAQWAIAVL